MSPNTVAIIWFGGWVAYAIWDIFLATDKVKRNTESEVTRYWSERIAALPMTIGVLCMHWLHPLSTSNSPGWFGVITMIIISGTVTVGGLLLRRWGMYTPWVMTGSFIIGNVLGLVFWRV